MPNQTTTCCYYGSLHLEATKVLADLVHDRGGFIVLLIAQDQPAERMYQVKEHLLGCVCL